MLDVPTERAVASDAENLTDRAGALDERCRTKDALSSPRLAPSAMGRNRIPTSVGVSLCNDLRAIGWYWIGVKNAVGSEAEGHDSREHA